MTCSAAQFSQIGCEAEVLVFCAYEMSGVRLQRLHLSSFLQSLRALVYKKNSIFLAYDGKKDGEEPFVPHAMRCVYSAAFLYRPGTVWKTHGATRRGNNSTCLDARLGALSSPSSFQSSTTQNTPLFICLCKEVASIITIWPTISTPRQSAYGPRLSAFQNFAFPQRPAASSLKPP